MYYRSAVIKHLLILIADAIADPDLLPLDIPDNQAGLGLEWGFPCINEQLDEEEAEVSAELSGDRSAPV